MIMPQNLFCKYLNISQSTSAVCVRRVTLINSNNAASNNNCNYDLYLLLFYVFLFVPNLRSDQLRYLTLDDSGNNNHNHIAASEV